MTLSTRPRSASFVDALVDALGESRVVEDRAKIGRYLRDFSWYSPILESALADTTVTAVAKPDSLEALRETVAIAARNRVPLTMRGAGTGNYGQSLPLEDGLVVDVKGVAGVLDVSEGRIAVLPGTTLKAAEEAARQTGQELAVMPSTYRVATASGFICGGSGGIGASAHGDLWSGNVLAVELLTVTDAPEPVRLEGDQVNAVLHTYGTIGVITRVELRLVPRHEYTASFVTFGDFADACAFGWDLVDSAVHTRLASVQQAPIGGMFTPLAELVGDTGHVVLVWSDVEDDAALDELVARHRGTRASWPDGAPHITQFPYSHTILWSRRADPSSSWLQCEYAADDRGRFLDQVAALTERFPGVFLQHVEINKSRDGGVRCMGIPPLMGLPDHAGALDELIAFCTGIGVVVLNPHSYVVEEGGFVGDVAETLALKERCDPLGILNPGKLGASFFAARRSVSDAGDLDLRSPEQLDDPDGAGAQR
ncbi:FAD-binding oxidoreductase [Blastococcus sp. TF02A-26]|uniref:FAD-binding oxidoreductase n=1 Tax=Blastococcus sp. TF02A-26 TaxID=2250577 RepID=UPI000DE9CC8E|nr:FAD-binding oxidoreductase [Blastococcus sp. TF02A-26]RBY86812.1 hypothetical protein DQ240_08385 [Blastococcus sp. TF02A-26]